MRNFFKNKQFIANKIKNTLIIITLFIVFLIISAYSYASSISEGLAENIFRLHILANSDSDEDQDLKLKVRNEIIEYMKTLSEGMSDKQAVIDLAKAHTEDFIEIAEKVIHENGYDYPVNIEIGNFYFPTKYYGNISLPAGNYDALKIEIGEAKGQNWWCSLFPPLCFVGVSSGIVDSEGQEYLKENLSEEEFELISSSSTNVELKFKIVEIFNEKTEEFENNKFAKNN